MTMKQAIITFDSDRIAQLDLQAEAQSLAWIIKQALLGNDYPKERGIVSIALIEDGYHLTVRPPEQVFKVEDLGQLGDFPNPALDRQDFIDTYIDERRSSIKLGARPNRHRFKV